MYESLMKSHTFSHFRTISILCDFCVTVRSCISFVALHEHLDIGTPLIRNFIDREGRAKRDSYVLLNYLTPPLIEAEEKVAIVINSIPGSNHTIHRQWPFEATPFISAILMEKICQVAPMIPL